MNLDTACIPLGHIQTYFDLRKSLILEVDWLTQRSQIRVRNPHETLDAITGIDQREFYRRAGIPYEPGDQGGLISTRQCLSLISQAIETLKMPYLGLAMGNLMTASHHGVAGLAAITQPTLRECLECVCRLCMELFPPLDMSLREEGETGMLVISENISLSPYSHFFYELNFVSFYNIFMQLVGGAYQPDSIDFSYPEPEWGHIYRRYFRCPVRFNQPETRITGKASLGSYELPLANRLMAMSAEKALLEHIPTRAMRALPLRLRRMLLRYYGAFPSLENAASELGMSSRTLRRKLAEGGTSYQRELDAVREKLAKEYFLRGGRSVTELALLLGYGDSSAFAKAFRRWTGMSPSEFQDRLQASDCPGATESGREAVHG